MSDGLAKRVANLESLVESQQETIETLRARLAEQTQSTDDRETDVTSATVNDVSSTYKILGEFEATDGAGVLGRNPATSGTPVGVEGAVPNATSGYGLSTPDNAAVGGIAEVGGLGGSLTGGTPVTDLFGDRLTVSSGALMASITGVSAAGTQIYANADEINFGDSFEVVDDGNGAVTILMSDPASTTGGVSYVADSTLRVLRPDGTTRDYAPGSDVGALGTPADLTGDGTLDVPYTDTNNSLRLATGNGSPQTLDSGGVQGRIGVGDWDEDETLEVLYAAYDESVAAFTLHSVAVGENPTNFGDIGSEEAQAVAGVADFDGTGGQDVVWVEGLDGTYYLDYGDDPASDWTNVQYTPNTASGISPPADFTDTGVVRVAVVNSDRDIDLVAADGTVTTLSTSYAVRDAPMGALDWTGNGVPDILHVNYDTGELYYYNLATDTAAAVVDAGGSVVTPVGGVA